MATSVVSGVSPLWQLVLSSWQLIHRVHKNFGDMVVKDVVPSFGRMVAKQLGHTRPKQLDHAWLRQLERVALSSARP